MKYQFVYLLIISCVVDNELVVRPPSGLDTVRAPTGLVLHIDQGANRQLLKYCHLPY